MNYIGKYKKTAVIVALFSLSAFCDINLPKNVWTPTIFTPGVAVQYVRTAGLGDTRGFVKLVGYVEVQITNISASPGKELYSTALAAMTSGTKVSVLIVSNSVWSPGELSAIGLSGY